MGAFGLLCMLLTFSVAMLLMNSLMEYSPDELESEIFTLAQTRDAVKSKKKEKQKNAAGGSQTSTQPQIVLNEKQFNLIKKVYPKAFAYPSAGGSASGSHPGASMSHTQSFSSLTSGG